MNAREICSEVYGLSGFGVANSYQNGDIDDKLIFYLLRRVARDLSKYRWEKLVKTGLISIQGGTNVYNLPTDFREMIPGSVRTIGDLRPLDFPTSFETWAQIESQVGPTGVVHRLRFQEGNLVTLAVDTDSYDIRFDYISNFPVYEIVTTQVDQPDSDEPTTVTETTQKFKDTFELDADEWLLDDDLIIKALKTKWSLEKGLDTLQADAGDLSNYLIELKGTQAHSQRIKMGGNSPYLPQAPYTNLWK